MRTLAWGVVACLTSVLIGVAVAGCSGSSGSNPFVPPPEDSGPVDFQATREHRAIAGVSMGGYGAMNLGTKHPDRFGVIGSMGGPVDMRELLRHAILDHFEVKEQVEIPRQVGDDFTWDHMPPYPDRGTRIEMLQDLMIAFGNPVLHHPDPDMVYLASDSQPAAIMRDDRFGPFTIPPGPLGFLDGGDDNEDGLRQTGELPTDPTEVLLLAANSISEISSGTTGTVLGQRRIADLNGDGIFDVGDGIVINFSEPFTDDDGDLVYEPAEGETFSDVGLDGVAGTGDFGEGNGTFDYDPDRANWLAEDPLTRLANRSAAQIRDQAIYMDAGTTDEFQFAKHYENLVAVLEAKGIDVVVQDGFQGDPEEIPEPQAPFLYVRYEGGHVGIPEQDEIDEDLLRADFFSQTPIWQRITTLIGFLNERFPGDPEGPGGFRVVGDVVTEDIPSPALTEPGDPTVTRRVVVYRPPGFFNTGRSFPIVYFFGGYGQSPEDFERVGNLMDLLISTGEVQNMYFAFLPGEGGKQGSFLVNHAVPHEQVPEVDDTTGAYEDSILEDLMPAIENDILEGRIRR